MAESVSIRHETVDAAPPRQDYEVITDSGIFKNGKLHDKGTLISLDADTAARFKELGEIK